MSPELYDALDSSDRLRGDVVMLGGVAGVAVLVDDGAPTRSTVAARALVCGSRGLSATSAGASHERVVLLQRDGFFARAAW